MTRVKQITAARFKAQCLALLDEVAETRQPLPLTPRVAVRATTLGDFHGDPADRLIVATALIESCPVVTRDRRIRRYKAVSAIW